MATETQRHRGTAVPQIKTEATEARRHGERTEERQAPIGRHPDREAVGRASVAAADRLRLPLVGGEVPLRILLSLPVRCP